VTGQALSLFCCFFFLDQMKLTISIDADTRENLLIALEDVWGLIEAKKWQGRASFSDHDAEMTTRLFLISSRIISPACRPLFS